MKIVNCAIIEDEPLGTKTMRSLLKAYQPQFKVKRTGRNLKEAREIFDDAEIDLIFCDVELLDGNVFEVLKEVTLAKGTYIVFTTAYEEFGAKAFNYPALHYLLKPINPDEFNKAIARYREAALNEKPAVEKDEQPEHTLDKLLLPTQNGMLLVDYENVIRIQSSNKYSIVFTTQKKQLIVSKPLGRFEEVLAKKGFMRVHDSHIINLSHVTGYTKGKAIEIVMSDSVSIPVSVRKRDQVAALFKDLI